MNLEELKNAIIRIKEDIGDLFYYYGDGVKNETIREFEETWSEDGEADAHGA